MSIVFPDSKSVRLTYAAESLISSSARISDISATLGYSELSNFVRDFRSELGLCPAKFRHFYLRAGFVWTCPRESGWQE